MLFSFYGFYTLQILVIIMTFAEVASIFSITPFMAIVGDPSILEKEGFLGMLYIRSNLGDPYQFIFYLGLIVLTILIYQHLSQYSNMAFGNVCN